MSVWPADTIRDCRPCYYRLALLLLQDCDTCVSELRPVWPADTMSVSRSVVITRLRLVSELRPVRPADTMSVSRSVVITRL